MLWLEMFHRKWAGSLGGHSENIRCFPSNGVIARTPTTSDGIVGISPNFVLTSQYLATLLPQINALLDFFSPERRWPCPGQWLYLSLPLKSNHLRCPIKDGPIGKYIIKWQSYGKSITWAECYSISREDVSQHKFWDLQILEHDRRKASSSQVHLQYGCVGGRIRCCLSHPPNRVMSGTEPLIERNRMKATGLKFSITSESYFV